MALIKNDIPILEYDKNKKAVIMPGHHTDFHFTEKAVFLLMETEIEDYVQKHDCEVIGHFDSITKQYQVYKTVYKDTPICICQAPLGAPAAVQILDQLIAGGVKEVITAGCCGALIDDAEGDFFIPIKALRQEGTSYQYIAPSRYIETNKKAVNAIEKVLNREGLRYKLCKTWTTDGFYRETEEMVQYRKQEGCAVVEMECSALAACAQVRNIIWGQLLFTADTLVNTGEYDIRNWGHDMFEVAMRLAMDAVLEIDTENDNMQKDGNEDER